MKQVGEARDGAESLCPPIDLAGEPDWQPFDAPALVGASLRFVSGEPDGNRYRVRYYRDAHQQLQARVWFGPETEGPPGHAHGGSMAAVMDEVLGLAAWAAGHAIVVGNLNVSFRTLLPLETVVTVESAVVSAQGRKVLVEGRIRQGDTVYVEAQCLCITLPDQSPASRQDAR
ncbi:PaaI family thioesterase [Desulfuromonas thiophila]|uniref:PaaI family thioesterase n=1 Tax=Desulfuromonas thiophila TaxID=57664 RepID=UPI0029F4D4BF|nr:PaaI family thioesterase [Desulfuromonas thiophila]